MEEKGEGRRSRKVNGRSPDGAPELAECRQGQRGRRLKRTQTVSEEEEEEEKKTCPMGVEGSAAINHRTGFSAFLLVKGQARKRAPAASELIKARRPWMSSHQAVSGLITLSVLGGVPLAAPTVLQELPPKSAGHHASMTPIFKARTGGQERFKSSAKAAQAS